MASFIILPHIAEADIDPTSTDSQYERTSPPPFGSSTILSLKHRYQSIVLQERSDKWNVFSEGKDYSGAKFFYTEPISLNKAHSTKWNKAFGNKTLHLYNHSLFRKEYQQQRERYNSCFEAYTDGSNCEQKVAAAAVYPEDPDDPRTTRLRDGSSVFNAELEGLHLALKKFFTLYKSRKNFIVYTDSFSAVESLRAKSYRAKNVKRLYNLLKNCHHKSKWSWHGSPHMWAFLETKKLIDLQ